MNRRSLLIGLTALALTQAACQQDTDATLLIAAWQDMLPPQVLADFKRSLMGEQRLRVKTQKTSANLFAQLQTWHRTIADNGEAIASTANVPDWVGLSDYWLQPAIQQQLIRPLPEAEALPGWDTLPDIWRSLLQRNDQGFPIDGGPLWATPYRWGHLMMVYSRRRFEQLGWQPTAWSDLWHPDVQRRVALPQHPRIVLGAVLKALGASANAPNPAAATDIQAQLAALAPQVRAYMSDDYLQALIMGDVWLAVGWSTEIQPVLARYRQLAAVSPDPGTLLTADVWVRPNTTPAGTANPLSALDQQWLSYWWQPDVVTPLSLFSQGLSPLLATPTALDQVLPASEETIYRPTSEQLARSEFIQPLSDDAIAIYTQLWQDLRRSE
jgi:putative spermidine/putrescine transport system substrate-binding protein